MTFVANQRACKKLFYEIATILEKQSPTVNSFYPTISQQSTKILQSLLTLYNYTNLPNMQMDTQKLLMQIDPSSQLLSK